MTAIRRLPPRDRALPAEGLPDLRDLCAAVYAADLELVRYIDRRKRAMPPDQAAFATALRDARLQCMRHIERELGLDPYERR